MTEKKSSKQDKESGRDKPVHIPLEFQEALSDLLKVKPQPKPEKKPSRK